MGEAMGIMGNQSTFMISSRHLYYDFYVVDDDDDVENGFLYDAMYISLMDAHGIPLKMCLTKYNFQR